MLKVNRFILRYLIYSLFFVILFIIWSYLGGMGNTPEHLLLLILYEVLNWNLVIWFLVLLYFPFALIFSSQFRELILTTLAHIKERDERESFITGQASRFAFLSTLALLVLFLVFSTVFIRYDRFPAGKSFNNHRNRISIDFNYKLFQLDAVKRTLEDGTVSWSNSLPITRQGSILLLIIWQVLSYHYFARKKKKVE